SAHSLQADDNGVLELSEAETLALLDKRARELLGMPGEEFLRRWQAGEFDGQEEREDVWQVAFLLGGAFAPR
ncbi:MAG TPA: hypothetical protein VFY90_00250, partial [Tepidiformaceae bacterium]|nr:hypothetical protein [Tepidiformaceae bacterium]